MGLRKPPERCRLEGAHAEPASPRVRWRFPLGRINERNKETPTKPTFTKPTRRGNSAGLREVERTILKENKMI